MEELLRYEHVDISYNGVLAVHNVSFTLGKGEILGIVGESSSGKSTLIKAAMGLLGGNGLVTRGDIWYKGLDLPDLSDRELRKLNGAEIGMIFQSAISSLCPIRTVGAQLYCGAEEADEPVELPENHAHKLVSPTLQRENDAITQELSA